MPLIPKPKYNQIFASQAPSIDNPAEFNSYPQGWNDARNNNGKPTIKQFNYLQQTSDLKALWILQNGACLPYDETIDYAIGAPVLLDGILQCKTADGFSPVNKETPYTLKYFVSGIQYPLNAEIMLANGDTVQSTIANNTANPNVDMTGWVLVNSDSQIKTWSGRTQEQENKNFTNVLGAGATLNPALGYRKRLLANIPFKYPDYVKYAAIFGQYNCFPQGFTFDPLTNYIYLAIQSNSITTVAVWDISNKNDLLFKTIFKLSDITYTNEGLIVKWENGVRNLYFRNNSNRLVRLDITSLPTAGTIIPSSSYFNTGIPTGRNFSAFEDLFIVSTTTPTIGTGVGSRSSYAVYDGTYNVIDSIKLQDSSAGVNEGAPYEGILPKIQGFGKAVGGYIASSGGAPTGASTYTNVGTIMWDDSGNLGAQNLVPAQSMLDYVQNVLGKTPHYCETEGVYSDTTGRVLTLVLYVNEKNQVGSDSGGVLIFEEFSTHPDAYDFSKYITHAPSASNRDSASLYPITYFKDRTGAYVNGYFNPFTGKSFADWYEICAYMISCDITTFSYYANSGAIKPKDMIGADVPASYGLVTIKNSNNNTFIAVCESSAYGVLRFVLNYNNKTQTLISQKNTSISYVEMESPAIECRRTASGNVVQRGQLLMTPAGNFGLYDNTYKVGWIILGDSNGEVLIDRNVRVGGNLHSNSTTNAYSLGLPDRLWSAVYAVTGTINTSDERYKQQFRSLSDREKAAALEIKNSICLFKFNDAVDLKGDDARWHVGVKAQQVINIMESHDLNPFDYGFICFDEWEAQEEISESWEDEYAENDVYNENGEYDSFVLLGETAYKKGELIRESGSKVTQEYREAGSRYAIRYDELSMFILAAI